MPRFTPDYEWTLCYSPRSDDPFAPLEKIGTLHKAKSRQFSIVRNRAGSASFTIRTEDDMAEAIFDNVDIGDVRGTVRKCITIHRNDRMLWSGPIWGIDGSLDQDQISISCVGWLETLYHIILSAYADYSNDGNGTASDFIAFDLLTRANAQDPAHPLRVQPGTVFGTMEPRNRYYNMGQMLGPALQELSDVEAGFDVVIDPASRAMNLYSWDNYLTRSDVILGYRWGPNNLKTFGWQESAANTCNRMWVTSLGAPVGPVEDGTSLDQYGRFEEWNTISGANQEILAPYAEAELVVRSRPLVTYNVIPHTHIQNLEGPSLFDHYDIGDAVYASAQKGAFKIERQKIRVFGASVSLDDNGDENVTGLQLSPQGS